MQLRRSRQERHSPDAFTPTRSIQADLGYIVPSPARPRTYASTPPAGQPQTNARYEAQTVTIASLRTAGEVFDLDRHGFALISHDSTVRDFYDDAEVCYDSKTNGRARFAPRTAFIDPTVPTDAPPRESLEIRSLVSHAE